MLKQFLQFVLIFLVVTTTLFSQVLHPKREFRAAWIATVTNLDWPSSNNLPVDGQKTELISILDKLKAININSVFFQVRTECDALYDSPYEPWSYWLTGKQGKAPSPYYDPLQFAVQEAHKRGIEIQAWINPYRAVKTVKNGNPVYPLAANHVANQHPDWILNYGSEWILDPGNPNVRAYVTKVIMDIVNRYDIDGIHWDDYFYSYNGTTTQDSASWRLYHGSFTNKGDWRRNNVNLLVQEVHDSIQAVKPWIKFGISPFGIWKNGVPTGISGLDAYNVLYGDAVTWMKEGWLDYITPQLYWPFGGGQDYGKLMPWWASQTYNRHLYVGEAAYRIDAWSSYSEMPRHIRLCRETNNCYGNVYFRTLVGLLDNEKGFIDSLKNNYYKYPALLPQMSWKDSVAPNPPQNLKYERIASTSSAGLKWDLPQTASDGDTAQRYVVYRFNSGSINTADLNSAENIISIEGRRLSAPPIPANSNIGYYYVVTSLDRNSNESLMSNVVKVEPPAVPVIASPGNLSNDQRDTVKLKWYYPNYASSYRVQVSSDSTFNADLFIDEQAVADTFLIITNLAGMQKYYWRLNAGNAGGTSNYSQVYNFTTGFPVAPSLIEPQDKIVDVDLKPDFSWNSTPETNTYRFQLAKGLDFSPGSMVIDSTGLTDTNFAYSNLGVDLDENRIYFWRVSSSNIYGTSLWSSAYRFKTKQATDVVTGEDIPVEYKLYQNYPNPFNPVTRINFVISKGGFTTLKIYDMLGRQIALIVNRILPAGKYSYTFDGSKLSSGLYVYVLKSGEKVFTEKMILVK